MTHSELILRHDKIQCSEAGIECPRDRDHGRMLPMLDGATLICGKCGMRQAVKTGDE